LSSLPLSFASLVETLSSLLVAHIDDMCRHAKRAPNEDERLAHFLRTNSPRALVSCQSLCDDLVALSERSMGREGTERRLLEWLSRGDSCLTLSLESPCSTRAVQKLLSILGGSCRDALVTQLCRHTLQLMESKNGNYALTKAIEVSPRPALIPIIRQLEQMEGQMVARHPYGCRVLERLMEHSTEQDLGSLIEQCIAHVEALSRHKFGNFVIQSLLEHGSAERHTEIVQRLLPSLPRLAMHRTASHVVQKALAYCSVEHQRVVAWTLLDAAPPQALATVASSRYGSFVVEEVYNIFRQEEVGCEVHRIIEDALPGRASSHSFRRVAESLGLLTDGVDKLTEDKLDAEQEETEATAKITLVQ